MLEHQPNAASTSPRAQLAELRRERELRKDFLSPLAGHPGVYIFRCKEERVTYVGMSRDLKVRLSSWLKPPRGKRGRKQRLAVRGSFTVETVICDSAAAARRLEIALIQEFRPKFNVDGASWFLYPAMGLREDERGNVHLCWTTRPDLCADKWELSGVWRGLSSTRAAFDAVVLLLGCAGHETTTAEKEEIEFTAQKSFRQIPLQISDSLLQFLRGTNSSFLQQIFLHLVEKPAARARASEIQEALDILRVFWREQAEPLARRLSPLGRTWTTQKERDALFAPPHITSEKIPEMSQEQFEQTARKQQAPAAHPTEGATSSRQTQALSGAETSVPPSAGRSTDAPPERRI